MFFNLLAEGDATGSPNNNWLSWALIGVLVAVMVIAMVLMNRKSKKRQQEAEDLINAVKPGNKVKTIGGVCGIVVEVDKEENTFVLETGSETSGKCYMKFDRQAILQSDAVVEAGKNTANAGNMEEDKPAEEPFEEKPSDADNEIVAAQAAPVEEVNIEAISVPIPQAVEINQEAKLEETAAQAVAEEAKPAAPKKPAASKSTAAKKPAASKSTAAKKTSSAKSGSTSKPADKQ